MFSKAKKSIRKAEFTEDKQYEVSQFRGYHYFQTSTHRTPDLGASEGKEMIR